MYVTCFLGPGLAYKHLDQRGLALGQSLQSSLYLSEIAKFVHAFGASAQFTRSLRTSQQQHANDGDLAPIKIEGLLQAMFIFGDPTVRPAGRTSQCMGDA